MLILYLKRNHVSHTVSINCELFSTFYIINNIFVFFLIILAKRQPSVKNKDEVNKMKKEEIERKLEEIQKELNKTGGSGSTSTSNAANTSGNNSLSGTKKCMF